MTTSSGKPPLSTIQAILRKTTERLAAELAHPTSSPPAWSACEWQLARAVAAMHGVSALLWGSLRWSGPPEWSTFLADQAAHTEKRFARIQSVLEELDVRARQEGIALLALKGAALHKIGIYTAGQRPMADIDLLAHEQDIVRTARLLGSVRFRETHSLERHLVFEPLDHRTAAALGEHSENDVKIELHSHLRERLPIHAADVTSLVLPREVHSGLNDYRSHASLMSHLLLHAAGAMVNQCVRLLHLHDIALLSVRMSKADWEELFAADDSPKWWAFPPLALTARYYPQVTQDVLGAAAMSCPASLQRVCRKQTLSDVSLSHLWVDALPGLAWARTHRERCGYVVRRFFPDREMLRGRRASHTAGTAQAASWSALSQGRRILRWVVSRPARSATLIAVRAALDAGG